jgi:glycerol-1-phosphate dehydrogenase [NAD(P)+]
MTSTEDPLSALRAAASCRFLLKWIEYNFSMLTQIKNSADFLSRDSAGLASTNITCPHCGQDHTIPIGAMQVGYDLINTIPDQIERILGHKPKRVCLVYDRAIETLIQDQVISPLTRAGLPLVLFPHQGEPGHLLDSEENLGNASAARLDPDVDILIGAGSGVVCDLTKWIATRSKRPFIIFGTAPSMNAYTSITATITQGDIKITHLLDIASLVMMDVNLQAAAPMDMIQAGIGDLAARSICSADWMLAHHLQDAYFCPLPFLMTAENERRYLSSAAAIRQREPKALEHLSEAVMMSGLSMTVLNGETSPSSGAEHVISHFWDLLTHVRGLHKNFHGTQVGVGTLIMISFYEYMRRLDIRKIDPRAVLRARPSLEEMEAENTRLYGRSAGMFNEVVRKKRIPDAQVETYIRSIQERWDGLWTALAPYTPSLPSVREPFLKAGVAHTLAEVQRTREEGIEALVKGPQYRIRYTLLDLAWELGVLPGAAEEILSNAGVLE